MFGFFYNILATISGGRKFEKLSHYHLKKVQSTLAGSRFSAIGTQVFALLTRRQQSESFFSYLRRRKALNALPDTDKQILINSEKKRLTKNEKNKNQRLQNYLNQQFGSTNGVQDAVDSVLHNKLSASDAKLFEQLTERQERESWFSHLKRAKKMYQLTVEQKQALVNQEKQRQRAEQSSRDNLLKQFLQTRSYEKVQQQVTNSSQQVEDKLASKQKLGLRL